MKSDESALIAAAKEGSAGAFCQLAESYRNTLFRFLWLRCGNRADAEDAVQDALLSAWQYLDTYRDRWQFSTWLYRIALRKLKKPNRHIVPIDGETGTEDDVLSGLERDNLWRIARTELKEQPLLAMWLHYGEGESISDIALALSRSESWVKVNLMRARNKLAETMGAQTG